MARRRGPPEAIEARVAELQADDQVLWLGVKHYSVAAAVAVERAIREAEPAVVLVEGPDDATPLIDFLVHPDTRPPVTILSSVTDKKNAFGQNGVLSVAPEVPARFRGWWPVVPYAPEYRALVAGRDVGAELAFIDAPLGAQIPFEHVPRGRASEAVDDRRLAESAYFRRLAARGRWRSFEAFWQATFEARGLRSDPQAFQRALLTFGSCARQVAEGDEALVADGTLLREAHMRWHIDRARKAHPDGRIAVVVGAFHAAALKWAKGKRARVPRSAAAQTLLCQHSYRALARLYELNRQPAWGDAVWRHLEAGSEAPCDDAGQELLLRVLGEARRGGVVVSTGDGVGAWAMARNLATLRGAPQVGPDDLADAALAAFVKGDARAFGGPVEEALREVLTGAQVGAVCAGAGRPPLIDDFYAQAKTHRIDVSGARKTVRCDLGKHDKHREKSALLHRCELLDVPLFGRLEGRNDRHFQGPDLLEGLDLHLVGESWAIRWREAVDDRLLELSDRGATVGQAAAAVVRDELEDARGEVPRVTKLLVAAVQMRLLVLCEPLLDAVEAALATDEALDHLVRALVELRMLVRYRSQLPEAITARVGLVEATLYQRAVVRIPSLRGVADDDVEGALDRLQTLVRYAVLAGPEEGLDLGLLADQLRALVAHDDTPPALRGMGCGVLYSLGRLSERAIEAELRGYARGERVVQVGAFLDGLFQSARSLLLVSERLQHAVHQLVVELDPHRFEVVLPDLRRAFTRFIPSEVEAIGRAVALRLGRGPASEAERGVPREALAAMEQRIEAGLSGHGW